MSSHRKDSRRSEESTSSVRVAVGSVGGSTWLGASTEEAGLGHHRNARSSDSFGGSSSSQSGKGVADVPGTSSGGVRSPVGLRTRRRQLEAERRTKTVIAIAGVLAAVMLVIFVVVWVSRVETEPSKESAVTMPGTGQTLLFVYAPEGVSFPADTIVLFGLVGEDRGSALLIPSGTTTDVPVHGPSSLGEATTYGGADLIELATENLIGVRIDATVILDRHGLIDALEPLQPFEVLVEGRLGVREGKSVVTKFHPGSYQMDASMLNAYLELRAEGESEIVRMARKQRAFEAIFKRARELPDTGIAFTSGDGSHVTSNVPLPSLSEIAGTLEKREISFSLLPVDPKQTLEGSESFEPRDGEIQRVVNQRFPGAAVAPDVESRIRIGILNGNGGVGVTEDVAKRLIPGGFRVVYTENADRFDYEETQIVFYRTPDERLAREVRSRLGTGKLVFNHEMQDVVDILIVVGRDYPSGQGSQGSGAG